MAYLKWQSILKWTTGTTISLLVLLSLLSNLAGMSFSDDGDKFCIDCYSEIRINSIFWEVKVEHAGDRDVVFKKRTRSRTLWVNLDKIDELVTTDPKIKVDIFVPAIKRTSTFKHDEYGYLRPIKDKDSLIKRTTIASPSPSRIILHANKPIDLTVKWSFDMEYYLMEDINIDPIWMGVNLIYEKRCEDNFFEVQDWGICSKNVILVETNNITKKNLSTIFIHNFTCKAGSHIENQPICENTAVTIDGTNKIDFKDRTCRLEGFILECVHNREGREGVCGGENSGKDCIRIDIRDLSKSRTSRLTGVEDLKVEKV